MLAACLMDHLADAELAASLAPEIGTDLHDGMTGRKALGRPTVPVHACIRNV